MRLALLLGLALASCWGQSVSLCHAVQAGECFEAATIEVPAGTTVSRIKFGYSTECVVTRLAASPLDPTTNQSGYFEVTCSPSTIVPNLDRRTPSLRDPLQPMPPRRRYWLMEGR